MGRVIPIGKARPARVRSTAPYPPARPARAAQRALPGALVEHETITEWRDVPLAMLVASDDVKIAVSGAQWRWLDSGQRLLVQAPHKVPVWRIRWRALPPSQNDLMRKYKNKHVYQSLVNGWQQVLWAAMVEGRIPKASARRRVDVHRYVRANNYLLDRGNLVGGCKPVLDAAVHCGLLVDDREEHLDDHYHQAVDPTERVEICVRDL